MRNGCPRVDQADPTADGDPFRLGDAWAIGHLQVGDTVPDERTPAQDESRLERRELLRLASHCGDDPDEFSLAMTTAGLAGCGHIGSVAPIPILWCGRRGCARGPRRLWTKARKHSRRISWGCAPGRRVGIDGPAGGAEGARQLAVAAASWAPLSGTRGAEPGGRGATPLQARPSSASRSPPHSPRPPRAARASSLRAREHRAAADHAPLDPRLPHHQEGHDTGDPHFGRIQPTPRGDRQIRPLLSRLL